MAQYLLADSEVGMWSCWGVHSVVVGRGSSRLSTSAQSLFRVLGNGLWFRTPGLVCMAPDPEYSDASIGSIWAPAPLSEWSLLSWFAVSGKLFNFTEISSTRGVDLSPQGWVTITANYRKCQSEAVLPLWRPREEKKTVPNVNWNQTQPTRLLLGN